MFWWETIHATFVTLNIVAGNIRFIRQVVTQILANQQHGMTPDEVDQVAKRLQGIATRLRKISNP